MRSFSEDDVAQLHLIEALRKSGLSIEGIQYYVKLSRHGASTVAERLSILQARETVLEYQRDELDPEFAAIACGDHGIVGRA